ncbi:MAG: hypothetical protein E7570_01555 [Ruminococcaceae bacterium]|nr:hypothetical protein [Oscillospiraceae bacterium]
MLLLSSMDFSNENSKRVILENLPKPVKQCRILYFPNENFSRKNIENRSYRDRLKKAGFAKNNIFVFDYDNPSAFSESELDCIYIGGGNTFKTFQKIRDAKADELIVSFVKNGAAFIGGSAGAHIVSMNIEHIKNFDELPEGFTDFNGLGLFNGILICHYSKEREKYYLAEKEKGKYPVYTIKDDECLIINA